MWQSRQQRFVVASMIPVCLTRDLTKNTCATAADGIDHSSSRVLREASLHLAAALRDGSVDRTMTQIDPWNDLIGSITMDRIPVRY